MIEQFDRINQFMPAVFASLQNEEKIDLYEKFILYLSNELNIVDDYELNITNYIGSDISRHSDIDNKKEIQINAQILDLYESNVNKEGINLELTQKLAYFPFHICLSIVHEMKHAEQCQKYTKEYNEIYQNVKYPISQEPLYILQKTEHEAFNFELTEMESLYSYFVDNNLLTHKEIKDFEILIQTQKEDIKYFFEQSMSMLIESKQIKKDNSITFDNYETKVKIFNKTQELIRREVEFVKLRNDYEYNSSDYIEHNIEIGDNTSVNYKIKNDNGLWNIKLELTNKSLLHNVPSKFDFALDHNECKVYYTLLNQQGKMYPKNELLTYVNAFIERYPYNINKIKISDFAQNLDYKQNIDFLKNNRQGIFKKQFNIKPNLPKEKYKQASELIQTSLLLDDIIKLNTINKKVNTHLEIIR